MCVCVCVKSFELLTHRVVSIENILVIVIICYNNILLNN